MFERMKISTRILSGFAVTLGLLALLALLSVRSMSLVGDAFGEFEHSVEQSSTTTAGGDNLWGLRLARLDFAMRGDPQAQKRVEDGIAELLDLVGRAKAVFPDDDEVDLRRALAAVEPLARDYQTAFSRFQEARVGKMALFERYKQIADDFSSAAFALSHDAHEAGDEQLAFLAADFVGRVQVARMHRTEYVTTGSKDALDAATATAPAYRSAMDKLMAWQATPAFRQRVNAVSAKLDEWIVVIKQLVEVGETERAESAYLVDVAGPKLVTAFRGIQGDVEAHQAMINDRSVGLISSSSTLSIVLGLGSVLIGAVLAWVIGNWIAGAVQRMSRVMGEVANGHLDAPVEGAGVPTELGAMADALIVFQQNGKAAQAAAAEADKVRAAAAERDAEQARQREALLAAITSGVEETIAVMTAMAKGDLTVSMRGNYDGAFVDLKEAVNRSVAMLRETVLEIRKVGDALTGSSHSMSSGAEDMSGRAENQAASLEQIAATMEEMAATVKNNAENAVAARTIAAEAARHAARGGEIVAAAVKAMEQIESGSGRIADIISIIQGFAFQTNLLALNAAVEAARAGDAGKGFAVVASEVRNLAQRSSDAARDIKSLIEESSVNVGEGVRLVKQSGDALADIMGATQKVGEAVLAITEASREQSTGVDEIASAISGMDQTTQQNSALADQSAASARNLSEHAVNLQNLMATFKTDARGARDLAAWTADTEADAEAARQRKRSA